MSVAEVRDHIVRLAKEAGFSKVYPYGFQKDDLNEIKTLLQAKEGEKTVISGGDVVMVADEETEFEPKRRTKALYTFNIRLHYSDPENFSAEKDFEAKRRELARLIRFSEEVFPEPPRDDGMQEEGQVIQFSTITPSMVGGQRWWSTVGVVRVVEQFLAD